LDSETKLENFVVNSDDLIFDVDKNKVEFPKPLSGIQRAQRALQFYRCVIPILYNYLLMQKRVEGLSEQEKNIKWNELHEWGSDQLANAIQQLKGFYVKTGQVISSRVDLFPPQYTTKLMALQDSVEAVPASLIKAIVRQELLEGEDLDTLFRSFEDAPLGSASIAQVHKAVLADGRTVAVKVQRPAEEPKLRGDIKNLKSFAKQFREFLPVDYFTVFSELERALDNELDFRAEAQSMEKIAATMSFKVDGTADEPPLVVPRPIPGLCTGRVIVMEFIEGVPLNRLSEEMAKRGISSDGSEAKVFGLRLIEALTEAFARMIFGPGFIHGDPHPGNIFVLEGGKVALIDCGQVKQLPGSMRLKLAEIILLINEYSKNKSAMLEKQLGEKVRAFGVKLQDGIDDSCFAAVAILLFGQTGAELPGGFSSEELSANSPFRFVTAFPQELVMMGRATVLIKGISSRLNIKWDLGQKWEEAARMALACGEGGCFVPVYATNPLPLQGQVIASNKSGGRVRFADVRQQFRALRSLGREWAVSKSLEILPPQIKKTIIKKMAEKIE